MHSNINNHMGKAAMLAIVALLLMFFAFTAGNCPAGEEGVGAAFVSAPQEAATEQEVTPAFLPLDVPLDAETQYAISVMCLEAGVPFEVEISLIGRESDFRPDLVSNTDDHGIAQINRCNHEWLQAELGPIDFYDPIQNVRAGLRILGPLWAKYDPHRALMAYKCGEGGAQRKWARGQDTSPYSCAILARAAGYGWDEGTQT